MFQLCLEKGVNGSHMSFFSSFQVINHISTTLYIDREREREGERGRERERGRGREGERERES